ncbi:MAG: CpsD/CapB family tyrosine-protein kinase [Sedimentibacter sp.]
MERYMVNDYHGSSIAESYRKIAANIEFANIDNNIKTIMVTSSLANEGKTTTIANLASVITDSKEKILLIDLDLRKPAVHKQFKISNKIGLTDLLINKDSYKNYINSVYDGLDVITSGKIPANPAEIVNSKAIKELLKELSNNYDYIFIDTPPIVLVSDPITISTFTDAVILIIAYSETEKEIAKKSVESLKHVNANIIGTILNKAPVTKHNKYYYNYH